MKASISATNWLPPQVSARLLHPVGEHALAAEDQPEGGSHDVDLRAVITAAAQADDVQPGEPGAVSHHAAERNHVGLDPGHPTDHGGAADADELVDRRGPADHGVVADLDMPAHHHVVGNNHPVADGAIMRHVHHRHQQAVRPHPGDAGAGDGAAVDGDVLAHHGAVAEFGAGRLAGVFQVLRRHADGAERIQLAPVRRCGCGRPPRRG